MCDGEVAEFYLRAHRKLGELLAAAKQAEARWRKGRAAAVRGEIKEIIMASPAM
jgi:hypothetical protein